MIKQTYIKGVDDLHPFSSLISRYLNLRPEEDALDFELVYGGNTMLPPEDFRDYVKKVKDSRKSRLLSLILILSVPFAIQLYLKLNITAMIWATVSSIWLCLTCLQLDACSTLTIKKFIKKSKPFTDSSPLASTWYDWVMTHRGLPVLEDLSVLKILNKIDNDQGTHWMESVRIYSNNAEGSKALFRYNNSLSTIQTYTVPTLLMDPSYFYLVTKTLIFKVEDNRFELVEELDASSISIGLNIQKVLTKVLFDDIPECELDSIYCIIKYKEEENGSVKLFESIVVEKNNKRCYPYTKEEMLLVLDDIESALINDSLTTNKCFIAPSYCEIEYLPELIATMNSNQLFMISNYADYRYNVSDYISTVYYKG